ncbi:hypothetical protein [Vulcaniibacterium tengchongense]|nr:hypothetical protein [Vulcaniibacterium tengchongense]
MPIHHRYVQEIFDELKTSLSSGVKDCGAFLKKLENDSDWSFLIKVQALIETSITEALVSHLGEPRVRRLIERLPLADEEIGKLSLAKDLGLLDSPQRRFIRRLASLRNNLAHRVDHVDFAFDVYLSVLDKQQLASWQRAMCWFSPSDKNSLIHWHKFATNQPRVAVWFATYMLIALLHVSVAESQVSRKTKEAALKTAEELYAHLAPATTTNEG